MVNDNSDRLACIETLVESKAKIQALYDEIGEMKRDRDTIVFLKCRTLPLNKYLLIQL